METTLMREPQQNPPNPAQIPQPQQPTAPGTPDPYVYTKTRVTGPEAMLSAARAARDELGNQLERLEDRREELTRELRTAEGQNKEGLERRLAAVDQRIAEVEQRIAAADDAVANAAAIPGAAIERPDPPDPFDPNEAMENAAIISTVFTIFVLFPIAFAFARRLWRRSAVAVAELPKVLAERLTRLDQAVDTIAIEVERISEGQRFLTKVMTDNNARALGGGAAQPIEIPAGERTGVPRG